MHYPCSENKGADQLRSDCEADLHICFHINPCFSQCGSYELILTLKVIFFILDTDYPGMNEVTLLTAVTVFVLYGAKLINQSQALFSCCMRVYLDNWETTDTEVCISIIISESRHEETNNARGLKF